MFDAHVHVGYYSRRGKELPFYYSPRRVVGVLNRCGVEEFIVSSTCAQVRELNVADIIREMREIKRLAGRRAHIFFWLSGHLYDEDRTLSWMRSGLFEGVKLHECETPWLARRRKDLMNVLRIVSQHGLSVQFHSGAQGPYAPKKLATVACQFPATHFDFAHCVDMKAMSEVISQCQNVWTDTAYLSLDEFRNLPKYNWHGRLMLGSDLPVWQAHEDVGLTERYRTYCSLFSQTGIDGESSFRGYIQSAS